VAKLIVVGMLMAAVAGSALAGLPRFGIGATPEIDASAGLAGIALLSGGLLVLRGRRKS